jgi:SAM-dependent methyltransferase
MSIINKFIGRTFYSKTLFLLVVLTIILIFIWCNNFVSSGRKMEGFTQEGPFIVKRDDDIYDDFYAEISNKLYEPEINSPFLVDIMMKNAGLDQKHSILLFIGYCNEINILQEKGFNVFAIDKSQAIVDYNLEKHPKLQIKIGDYKSPMTYDSATFTHINCLGFNIYRIQDKSSFFRNIYNWLIPNGTMILQLADRNKFDTIIPAGKSKLLGNNLQKYAGERITETEIDFGQFTYNSKYDFSDANINDLVTFSESFTDSYTQKVRKNEQTYYFEDIQPLVKIIMKSGFTIKSQIQLQNDEFQYLFIFVRPH